MTYDLGNTTPELQEEIDKCYQKLVYAFLMVAEDLVKSGEADKFLEEIERD